MVDECGHGRVCDCRVIEVLSDHLPLPHGALARLRWVWIEFAHFFASRSSIILKSPRPFG